MRYDEREDGELLELAQAGWSPAFAVLVHRHTPALLAAFGDEPDPAGRVIDVFIRAMRKLSGQDPADSVEGWLFALAGRPVPETTPQIANGTDPEMTPQIADGTVPETTPQVADDTVDAIWRELVELWPDGRRRRRRGRPRPVARAVWALATVVGAVALGVAVPTIVLGMPPTTSDEIITVRAQPLEEPLETEPDAAADELPTFEFPDIGDPTPTAPTDGPSGDPTPPGSGSPTPTAPVTPTPPPTPTAPEPDPEGPEAPAPDPEPQPDPDPTPSPPSPDPGDGNGGDDGTDGDGGEAVAPSDGGGSS